MTFFKPRWLYRIIRKRSSPIPEENALRWKKRLAIAYAILAWNAFGFVCYTVASGNGDWAKTHGLKSKEELELSPGQQWAQILGKKNAKIYRIDGFNVTQIENKLNSETADDQKETKQENLG